MNLMGKIRQHLLDPYIRHLSLANRHNVSKQMLEMPDKDFDNLMKMLIEGGLTFSDYSDF